MDGANTTPASVAEPENPLAPQVRELVARVFADGTARLRSEDGAELRAERVATYRDLVMVHAPRLALEPELVLTGTCETPHPWAVSFVVRRVEPYSASTDTATLEAVRSSLYPERRSEPRVETGGEATLTVHYGVEMVEKEQVPAVLVNASRSGLAFATGAELAVGAQVTLEARLLLGALDVDVQVRWRGASRVPEMHQYGCRVLQPSDASATTLGRLVDADPGATEREPDRSVEELRRSLAAKPGWRGLIGRRARADV